MSVLSVGLTFLVFISSSWCVYGDSDSTSNSESSSEEDNNGDDQYYDYVIVGGGAAGLSTMAFINKLSPDSSILTIEKLGRIGGKGFTTYFTYNENSIHFENLAMRFGTNGYLFHVLSMTGLCDDVSSFHFPASDRVLKYRNHEAISSDITSDGGSVYENYWQYVYNFTDFDDEILGNGAENTLKQEFLDLHNNGSNPEDYTEWLDCLNNWELAGVPAKDWNRYGVFLGLLNCSSEYIKYRENDQYAPFFDNSYGESANLCRNPEPRDPFDKPTGSTGGPKTLENGFGQIASQLAVLGTDDYTKNEILINTEVTGVHYGSDYFDDFDEDYPYFVRVRNTNDWSINNEDVDDNSYYDSIFAKNVIFSIPTRNFVKLFGSIDPWRNEESIYTLMKESRGRVEYGYRVNLIYDDAEIANNISLQLKSQSKTDMMIRSVYYDSNWQDDNLVSILIHARREQAEWLDGLQSIGEAYDSGEDFSLDDVSEDNIIYSSKVLVDRVVKELSDLLNYDFPLPIAAFSQPAGLNDSNVDGLWLPKNGFISPLVREELRHPKTDENLYVASGAYSEWRADVYGAIESGYLLVKEVLELGDPFENVTYCFF